MYKRIIYSYMYNTYNEYYFILYIYLKSIKVRRKPTETIQNNTIKQWKEVELVIKTY